MCWCASSRGWRHGGRAHLALAEDHLAGRKVLKLGDPTHALALPKGQGAKEGNPLEDVGEDVDLDVGKVDGQARHLAGVELEEVAVVESDGGGFSTHLQSKTPRRWHSVDSGCQSAVTVGAVRWARETRERNAKRWAGDAGVGST